MTSMSATIGLPVADTIRAVDEIFARRQNRTQDFVRNVADDIESVSRLIEQKTDQAVQLFAGFRNSSILRNPSTLVELVVATDQFLTRRQLLPKLQEVHGRMKGYQGNEFLDKRLSEGIKLRIRELDVLIERYLNDIGAHGAFTGTNYGDLLALNALAKKLLAQQHDTDENNSSSVGSATDTSKITDLADDWLTRMDLSLVSRIHQELGRLQGLLLAATG